jgi:hypothetical protein
MREVPSQGQRTLDPAPVPPPSTVDEDPSDVLEAPPPQASSAKLEERQGRWLRLRESALETKGPGTSPAPASAKNSSPDPKG